jgi:hypothetical protein
MTSKPGVPFVRVYNAGRFRMAAGWLRHLAGEITITMDGADSCPVAGRAKS